MLNRRSFAALLLAAAMPWPGLPAWAGNGGDNNGNGGGNGNGAGGNAGDSGGDNEGDDGDDGGDNEGDGGGTKGGDQRGAAPNGKASPSQKSRGDRAKPSPGDIVEQRGSTIRVTHRNGMREQIAAGRYRMTDNKGRTIVERPATKADEARLRRARR